MAGGRLTGRYQKTGAGEGSRPGGRLAAALLAACTALSAAAPARPAPAVPAVTAGGVQPVQAVVAAHDAVERRQWTLLPGLVEQSRGDPLSLYPEYWLLRYRLQQAGQPAPVADLERFLQAYAGTYLADRLRGDWILAAERSGDFATIRRLGPVLTGSAQVECARLLARHMGGQRASAQEALAVFEPGKACWSLYDQLVADGVLGWDHLEPRLREALEANRTRDARRYAAYIFEPDQIKAYDQLMRDPMKWLVRQARPARTRAAQELAAIALARLARKDMDVGDSYLRREWSRSLPAARLQWVRSQFALVAALNLDDRAHQWYAEAGKVPLTEYNHAWRVRSALRQSPIDWKWVVQSVDEMPDSQRAEPVWVYWRSRGLAATGHRQEAERGYASIANQYHFYGQLAAEELGQAITVPPAPPPLTEAEIAEARAVPGLQRAIALFRLGWRAEAVPEWNFSLRGMNDRQLRAAAEVAREADIYDRVVNTSERTRHEVDFSQRFIAPFEGRVAAQARSIQLDPAWVYGLIRQESRFITDARSVVGASGLMQLMPATARWVARKIGMADFHPSRVNEFETNTRLGTSYLNIVLQDLNGSQVLASAGYNAGPRRPHRWRGQLGHPVEGAIFAETIPFTETRLYVKNVMSNATYYAALFSGQPQSLKQRLGRIVPQASEASSVP